MANLCACGCGALALPGKVYIHGHQSRRPAVDRFWEKVDQNAPGGCWLWTDFLARGYGRISIGGRMVRAHRFAYELLVGPVPEGLEIDHLCRVRHCVNPAHLEPVTHAENLRRSDSISAVYARRDRCASGHEFTAENTYVRAGGHRDCRACNRERQRQRRAA